MTKCSRCGWSENAHGANFQIGHDLETPPCDAFTPETDAFLGVLDARPVKDYCSLPDCGCNGDRHPM